MVTGAFFARRVFPLDRLRSAARAGNITFMIHTIALVAALTAGTPVDPDEAAIAGALERADDNRAEIERALAEVPADQARGMRWLVAHMPERDLESLDADFLLENCQLAYEQWRAAPWHEDVDEAIFFDAILPYANVNERRDRWRADFIERFGSIVADAQSPGEAATLLNRKVFPQVSVRYSTQRAKPDQSPFETIDSGMASCTGLSILLIDACRAVGVPARFVGTPLWSDGSGNHSWVEVWDDGWHFTGAAEPAGDELDKAWFAGRAATATRDDPRHGIYAVTWRNTPIHFPLVWRPGDESVNAVDVTDRYIKRDPVPDGRARVRFRVRRAAERCAAEVAVTRDGEHMFTGLSKDERFDANDHLEAILPLGASVRVAARFDGQRAEIPVTVTRDEQLVDIVLEAPDASSLSRAAAEKLAEERWNARVAELRAERDDEMDAREIRIGDSAMPFWFTTYGDAPAGGRSLYISMHGGGGAPKRVNDGQWNNQKRLYKPAEGVYLAPRAPTDTWNLWHRAHVDACFDRLITNLIVFEGVDPDRVYLTGYSAGGDGVYQLAPRMADRFGAAAMMAGHPNETRPDGLRNLPFALHMGGDDGAYNRNGVARSWKTALAELAANDPGGYEHWVEIHEGKGHWMDGEDAAAIPWMAGYTRNLRPERIVWLQDDVTHPRFYWLAIDAPRARARLVVERDGQTITILEGDATGKLHIRLDDSMLDLDETVTIVDARSDEPATLFSGIAPRSREVIERTLAERDDPRGIFVAEVTVPLGE